MNLDTRALRTKRVRSLLDPSVYATFICSLFEDPAVKVDDMIDFLDITDIDIHKLKFFIPYAQTFDYDMTVYFPTFKDTKPIRTCLQMDMIMVGETSLDKINMSRLITAFPDTHATINYHTQYVTFFDQTMNYLKQKNMHIQERDNLPILEQFVNIDIVVDDENVDGYYRAKDGTLELTSSMIKGLPITMNSTIILKQQDRTEENGTYKVVSPKMLQKKVANVIHENPTFDHRYECYDQPLIKSRGLCISSFDADGIRPKPKMIWDRRCERNEECPFYQSNKNYKNYFGGCIDGFCQMPLGVKPLGYRQYDLSTKPMCHRCKDPLNPFCCEDQKNKATYSEMVSPDYAFPLDEHARFRFFS
jgi:hypothetical protein